MVGIGRYGRNWHPAATSGMLTVAWHHILTISGHKFVTLFGGVGLAYFDDVYVAG